MKIFLNGLLFWITISSYCDSLSGSEKEESDFYQSLKDSSNRHPERTQQNVPRTKRATLKEFNDGVYESEVKVLGRIDGEAKNRAGRALGDPDFSISVSPLDPSSSQQDPSSSKQADDSSDSSLTVVSSVDPDSSKETEATTVDSRPLDKKRSDESDIGIGIEVESEEKLADEDVDDSESTSQTTVGEIALSSRSDITQQVLWPTGTYGLPKPISGCPDSSGFLWSTGLRFYDTEDDGTENHQSAAFHLAGNVTEDGVTLEFCMKTKDVGLKSWPSGKYCVYKKGGVCPGGLKSGFVYWDDENRDNKNFFAGTLPEGTFTDKTKISFCCSTSGNVNSTIILPTEKPFYLFPFGSSECQKVKKMRSTLEFVKFDEEDKGDIEKSAGGFYPYDIRPQEKDHTVFMCFYQLQDEDDAPLVSGGIENSEKIAHSEKIIHEFMKSKETNEPDEISKEQESRTRNSKKFPSMQTSTSHAIMIATGFVLTTVAILVGALLVISFFTKRWSKELTKARRMSNNGPKEIKKKPTDKLTKQQKGQRLQREATEQDKQKIRNEVDFVETETEQEEEELVEDQFLPSDSQLKSGLEFLFLKQQKRKWLARNSRNK